MSVYEIIDGLEYRLVCCEEEGKRIWEFGNGKLCEGRGGLKYFKAGLRGREGACSGVWVHCIGVTPSTKNRGGEQTASTGWRHLVCVSHRLLHPHNYANPIVDPYQANKLAELFVDGTAPTSSGKSG